jgi:WD40 repeat protein
MDFWRRGEVGVGRKALIFWRRLRAGVLGRGRQLVRQHDTASGRLVREYKGHGDWVYAVDYHPATGRVASGAFDGEVRVWDAATGECVCRFTAAPRRWLK